jgi:hypothetical protein
VLKAGNRDQGNREQGAGDRVRRLSAGRNLLRQGPGE